MIIDEKINRFASNFGVIPTSIALASDYTTPLDATNLELAGPSFSSEKDFGDGLGGLGLGFTDPALSNTNIPDAPLGFNLPSFNLSDFIPDYRNWDWHEWLIALGGGYTLYQIFFGPRATARKRELESAEEGYRKRRKRIKEDYSFSPFGTGKRASYGKD